VYGSRHVQFNPNEYPYPNLFQSSGHLVPVANSPGPSSTEVFHYLPSFSINIPRVPQSVSSLSHTGSGSSINTSLVPLENPTVSHPSSLSSSRHSSSSPSSRVPKYKLPLALSVHPMLTRSQAKLSLATSPHVLLTTLEPSSIHDALLDPHWAEAISGIFCITV